MGVKMNVVTFEDFIATIISQSNRNKHGEQKLQSFLLQQ